MSRKLSEERFLRIPYEIEDELYYIDQIKKILLIDIIKNYETSYVALLLFKGLDESELKKDIDIDIFIKDLLKDMNNYSNEVVKNTKKNERT